jgi:dephospho-CoA kinase
MERDKIDQPKAEARLRAQNDEEFYRCRSSIVISNDGSFGQLRSEVERIYLAIMNGNNY